MYNDRFEKNERRARTKAKVYTLLLFGSIFAATVYFGNNGSMDFFQSTTNVETEVEQEKDQKPVKAVNVSKKSKKRKVRPKA